MPTYIAEVVSDDPFVINVRDQSNPSTVYVGRVKPRRVSLECSVCARILREIFARHPERIKYEMKLNMLLVVVWIQYSVEGIQVRDPERLDIECYAGNLHSHDIMEPKRNTAALEKQHEALVQDIQALVAGSKDRSVDRECINQILVKQASERAQLLKRLEASDALVAKLEQEVNRSKDATRALREFCGDMIGHSFICAMMDYVIDTRGKCKVPITVDTSYEYYECGNICLPNGDSENSFYGGLTFSSFVHVSTMEYNKHSQEGGVYRISDYEKCDNVVFIIYDICQNDELNTVEIRADRDHDMLVVLCVDNADTLSKLSSTVDVRVIVKGTDKPRTVKPHIVVWKFDDLDSTHWIKFIPKKLINHSEMQRLCGEYKKMMALEIPHDDE